MGKKLGLLFVVLALLGIVAGTLSFVNRPGAHQKNPLKKFNLDKVSRIDIKNTFGSFEIEKTQDVWKIVSPVKDLASPSVVNEILEPLKSFSLGSVVSENPAKYPQFSIDDSGGIQLQIYLEGDSKPILNGFVGKMTSDYQTCYFRFSDSKSVYVASGIMQYVLNQEPRHFRLSKVVAFVPDQVTSIAITQDKNQFDLTKSSVTWTDKATGQVVESEKVKVFLDKISKLEATDFGNGTETEETLGFLKSVLSVHLNSDGKSASFVVGGKALSKNSSPPQSRYVKSEGRDVALLIREEAINDLLASVKNLR